MAAPRTATATIAGSETALPIHRLDVGTYNRIVASGALEGERVELLDGLVDVPAKAVEVYTDPGKSGYRQCKRYSASEILPCPYEGVDDLPLATLFENVDV